MQVAIFRRAWQGWLTGLVILAAAGWWYGHNPAARPDAAVPFINQNAAAARSFAKLPLAFEPNQGQSDGRVLFLARNPGYSLFLTAQEAVVSMRGAPQALRLSWVGANPHSEAEGLETLPGKRNYLKGSDPARWQRDVPTYGQVRYRNLYPGIDLVYYGRQQHLEYDLVVAPGADPAQIRLRLAGMDAVHMDKDGALQLQVAQQSLSLSKPQIYQETAAGKKAVAGGYVLLADNRVSLKLAAYDRSKPLIIDPVLTYSTYLGGSGAELGRGVAVDSGGNVYLVGQSASADFPFTSATKSGTDDDAFVAKFDVNGKLLYATYLGGGGTDRGFAVAVDTAHSAVFIAGDTNSPDFAGASNTYSDNFDAFIAKLSSVDLAPGAAQYAAYLGGSNAEEATGIAVDASGNAYLAGATLSSAADGFPATLGTFNASLFGSCKDSVTGKATPCSDAFVAKYDLSVTRQFVTYLGGSLDDAANGIAVDKLTSVVYVTGVTSSAAGFQVTADGLQQTFHGGTGDAYLIKLDGTNGNLLYGTYLGGGGWDQGEAVAVDSSGNVYLTGATNSDPSNSGPSNSLPLTHPAQAVYGGGVFDAFIAKLKPSTTGTGYDLQYFTYLGGADRDFGFGIAADSGGNAYVVGETMSTNFRVDTALQSTWFGGGTRNWGDAFVTKITATGSLWWSTYLGGSDDDWANAVALDGATGIYVAGTSFSSDFPAASPYQASAGGGGDAILFKMNDTSVTADLKVGVSATPDLAGSGDTITYTIVTSNLNTTDKAGGVVVRTTLPSGVSYKSATPANSCTASGAQVTCKVGDIAAGGSATTTVAAVNNTAGDITFTAQVVRANQPDPDPSNNSASVSTKAAVGSTSGGGAWSWLEWLVGMFIYLSRRRSGAALRAV